MKKNWYDQKREELSSLTTDLHILGAQLMYGRKDVSHLEVLMFAWFLKPERTERVYGFYGSAQTLNRLNELIRERVRKRKWYQFWRPKYQTI